MATAANISCSTVPALGEPEAPASVSDHNFPIILELVEDTAQRKEAGVRN